MGGHVTRRPGRFSLFWCGLYTLAVPPLERERRRAEIDSHIWEAAAAWGPGWRTRISLVSASVLGAVDDITWCGDVRIRHGMRPLLAEAMLGQVGATVVAAVAMVATYLLSLPDGGTFLVLRDGAATLAAGVTAASLGDRAWRRSQARRSR